MPTDDLPFKLRPTAEDVVAVLKRELPGFASRIHAGTDTFQVRGPILFYGRAGIAEFYADDNDPERYAALLIERTRRDAIEALGLKKVMDEREHRAYQNGLTAGRAEGKKAGIAEGRRSYLLELAELITAHELELPDA